MHKPSRTSFTSPLQRVIAARQAYFEEGRSPDDLIDEAIFRSWRRCVAAERSERESVAFEPVSRSLLSRLDAHNHDLLNAVRDPLDHLARAVSGAGYAVLLTDPRGYALSVAGAIEQCAHPMRLALRKGVNLSEAAIGTSAMSCALNERRAVRVFGPEHFFSANQIFHCAAAPIFAPDGGLAGVVDITRDSPKPDYGALALVSQCARAIERELFSALPTYVSVNLSWGGARPHDPDDLLLAFGPDGEIVAMNEYARRFISIEPRVEALHFEDIFEGRFDGFVEILRASSTAKPVHLRSGLCLFASAHEFRPLSRRPRAGGNPASGRPVEMPEFGDAGIARQIETGRRALANGLPLLILGETGTGKEVVARALHAQGGRAAGPLVALNCAAIPESLIEGELFGHVDGAYTGARRGGMPGKIEMAHGGILFLDEIGDMPLHLQARLLRVLESRELSRLGSTESRLVDFQLICATHQDLSRAIAEGRFRADLFYRINGFVVTLPPLRARDDVQAIILAMLAEISDGRRALDPGALAALKAYAWPGNVRELKHMLTCAHAIADPGVVLTVGDFPRCAEMGGVQASLGRDLGLLAALEEDAIEHALAESQGKVTDAARILGISRATLYRRLQGRKTPCPRA